MILFQKVVTHVQGISVCRKPSRYHEVPISFQQYLNVQASEKERCGVMCFWDKCAKEPLLTDVLTCPPHIKMD